MGLTRRPFFVWQAKGLKHNDPLPCHDPAAVPAWYDRMKARGEFKHRCPKEVIAACSKATPTAAPARTRAPGKQAGADPEPPSEPSIFRGSSEARELTFQVDDLERHVEKLRVATESAFAKNNATGDDEARRLVNERADLLSKITVLRRRINDINEKEGSLINPDYVREDLGSIIPPMIATWQSEGSRFHRDCQTTMPRLEFMKLWAAVVTGVCRSLAQSKFADPLSLSAA